MIHTLIWYAQNDDRLPARLKQLIQTAGSTCCISRATLWEAAIKSSGGRLILPGGFIRWQRAVQEQGFSVLEITDAHLLALHQLAYVKDHRDPFDRLLIAQALTENLTLISRDAKFAEYPVAVRW